MDIDWSARLQEILRVVKNHLCDTDVMLKGGVACLSTPSFQEERMCRHCDSLEELLLVTQKLVC